ncbi:MAG TPA: divergent polysaccharide deacetylase family protein [Woeseiaceae bacterium]|nr:divergent polysaccharide deacetylase family protein [Woeseiaceae bacterium]
MTTTTWLARAVAAVALCCAAPGAATGTPRIAIIIDDVGHGRQVGERVIALPGPVACAILPGAPQARALARQAQVYRKEVLVHLPMEAANHRGGTEPDSLSLDMDRAALVAALDVALAALPQAIGVSNHRGSLLTRHPVHMEWLMQALDARETLFFVDSYTTHHSVALQIAAENGVRAVRRDVFLDSNPSPERVREEFERLKRLARERGSAIAIGHPHDVTLAFLEAELPRLADAGIRLVPLSEIVSNSPVPAYSNAAGAALD